MIAVVFCKGKVVLLLEFKRGSSGGRFDIGLFIISKHPNLWVGKWTAQIIGDRAARMISVKDKPTGVQLIREIKLDKKTSYLYCKQIIKNISRKIVHYHFWSRTLTVGGGICFIPLSKGSRFPKSYIMNVPVWSICFKPKDPNVKIIKNSQVISNVLDRVHSIIYPIYPHTITKTNKKSSSERIKKNISKFLVITPTPAYPLIGTDSYIGWFCYFIPNDLLFIKKFPVYPNRIYGRMASETVAIYYKNYMCELEAIGPKENIKPGKSASFTEEWWLTDFPYEKAKKLISK